ncbi:MAG: methylenetetrahydrofolate reductase C-terminal domain-containing protein [Deltaproteobacteria bacterium]|nr:methylenetetrahydrofolate reductase C-terminal domain-containing protein [Deltaproteobacteria bacterium]MBW2050471.1 methylenetetrahydrofolate reductase C-terminal domain-containing protein [Deltaproteobacteria bacterium]MBW2112123.1 methylenetetrahydrofolate reductase C-terminal domain-containing protein [Deltaproteobacteria bacterium]MBW2354859.1 methylenetetrahydrofolate reductase C-terminal domain-containing protein [Deltaproteobacteria bacterium]
MVVGDLKPVHEIAGSVSGFHNVSIVACGGCVSICLSGGMKSADELARELSHQRHFSSIPPTFHTTSIQRQCELDFVRAYLQIPPDTEAILSLACGAGVQTVAEVFETLPVIPALNTSFLGSLDAPGLWREKCLGCGECVLAFTGGICPVSRCAKRLLNGPCGGSRNGKCEIGNDVDCAWQLIIDRLKALGRLDDYEKIFPVKDWSRDRGKGPRSLGMDKTRAE